MGLHGPKIPSTRCFRFGYFSFAEALFIEAICRRMRGAAGVFPDQRPYPREPLHPSVIALFDAPPKRRVLIESPRRIVAGLKAKNGFSRLETFYTKMPDGFRSVHKDDPLTIEFWSFNEEDEASREIAGKLGRRVETPMEWLSPDKLRGQLQELESMLTLKDATGVGLDAVLSLLAGLRGES